VADTKLIEAYVNQANPVPKAQIVDLINLTPLGETVDSIYPHSTG
jgi:hypothetical protein